MTCHEFRNQHHFIYVLLCRTFMPHEILQALISYRPFQIRIFPDKAFGYGHRWGESFSYSWYENQGARDLHMFHWYWWWEQGCLPERVVRVGEHFYHYQHHGQLRASPQLRADRFHLSQGGVRLPKSHGWYQWMFEHVPRGLRCLHVWREILQYWCHVDGIWLNTQPRGDAIRVRQEPACSLLPCGVSSQMIQLQKRQGLSVLILTFAELSHQPSVQLLVYLKSFRGIQIRFLQR